MNDILPEEITFDPDNNQHVASFKYNDGIQYAKNNNLQFSTSFTEVFKGTHYLVCCGDVMVSVKSTDFPQIKRRTLE